MIDESRALQHLLDLLAVPGPSGGEAPVAKLLQQKLKACGVKTSCIKHDHAHKAIPLPYQVGNLIVTLPGTRRAPRLMFSGHMDTVPLCAGAKPQIRGRRIVPAGDTALGGDNRTALGVIVTLVETLLRKKLPHPPLTLLFTVGEEAGLWGARHVKAADLKKPAMGFNFDGGDPALLTIGAIGADRWEVTINGISAHAGVHPEQGVSAILIASRAIAAMQRKGLFGRVNKRNGKASTNVGIIHGGNATNEVTRELHLKGESRSHDRPFLNQITAQIKQCFHDAAATTTNTNGKPGKIKFTLTRDYDSFRLDQNAPATQRCAAAVKSIGLKPQFHITNGGLDANFLNRILPTVTLGAGQHNIHTPKEYVNIREYQQGCQLALALATAE